MDKSIEERNKSCADRIYENLKGRIEYFGEIINSMNKNDGKIILNDGTTYEDIFDWLNQCVLFYGDDPHYRAKRMELSWGGPQDYFLFFEDETIEYWFLDWFDGAHMELEGEEYEIMQQIYDMLGGE